MATIPDPLDSDADDVSLALEVAQSQWTRGDRREALKWLRKAADAAFEADDDKRGMELSKIAVELKATLSKCSTPPPPPPMPQKRAVPMTKSTMPPPRGKSTTGQPQPKSQRPPPRPKRDNPPSLGETVGKPRIPPEPRKQAMSAIRAKPPIDDEEATRIRQLDEVLEPSLIEEWSVETVDNVPEVSLEQTGTRKTSERPPERSPKDQPKKASRIKEGEKKLAATSVPSTRAIRVAASQGKDGVRVRLLDAQGLREGEHDAMLVALTSNGDIRTLFE